MSYLRQPLSPLPVRNGTLNSQVTRAGGFYTRFAGRSGWHVVERAVNVKQKHNEGILLCFLSCSGSQTYVYFSDDCLVVSLCFRVSGHEAFLIFS